MQERMCLFVRNSCIVLIILNLYYETKVAVGDVDVHVNPVKLNFKNSISQLDDIGDYFKENVLSKSEVELVKHTFGLSATENIPKKKVAISDNGVMDTFWSLFNFGKINIKSRQGNVGIPKRFSVPWLLIQDELVPGSILEVGDCAISQKAATYFGNLTIISMISENDVSDDSEYLRSPSNNHYLVKYSPDSFQKWVEELSVEPVMFGNVIIHRLYELSSGLLPHEFEIMMSKVLLFSQNMFLVNTPPTVDRINFLSNNWPHPSTFVDKICTIADVDCDLKLFNGDDEWHTSEVIFQISIEKSKRDLDETFCSSFKEEQCFLEYVEGSPLKVASKTGKELKTTINNNDVPFYLMQNSALTNGTQEILFGKLLENLNNSNLDKNLVLSGTDIVYRTLWMPREKKNTETYKQFQKTKSKTIVRGKNSVAETVNIWEREGHYQHTDKSPLLYKMFNREPDIQMEKKLFKEISGIIDVNSNPGKINPRDLTDTILTTEEQEVRIGLNDLTRPKRPMTKTPIQQKYQKHRRNEKKVDSRPAVKQYEKKAVTKTAKIIQGISNARMKIKNNDMKKHVRSSADKTASDSIVNAKKRPNVLASIIRNQVNQKHQTPKLNSFSNMRRLLWNQPRRRNFENFSQGGIGKDRSRKISTVFGATDVKEKIPIQKSKRILNSAQKDEMVFDEHYKHIKTHITDILSTKHGHNIFTYGKHYQCLLSNKLSLLYPRSNFVTMIPKNEEKTITKCRHLITSLSNKNNLFFNNDLTARLINQLSELPQTFKLQILDVSIFANIINIKEGFLLYLGKLLVQAEYTIMELPPLKNLKKTLALLNTTNKMKDFRILEKGLIYESLKLVNAEYHFVKVLSSPDDPVKSYLVLIKLKSFTREVTTDCTNRKGLMLFDDISSVTIKDSVGTPRDPAVKSKMSKEITTALNLQYLLTLGPQSLERKTFYRAYLQLQVEEDMCPLYIVWKNQSLYHIYSDTEALHLHSKQSTIHQLKEQMKDTQFSFLDINNDNDIVINLATEYPNSTFIAIRGTDAEPLYNNTVDKGIENIAVTSQTIDTSFTSKLLHSPDIFRYQFLGSTQFQRLADEWDREKFDQILGTVLSTGITTFIQLPSAQMLSLSALTFYPDVFEEKEEKPSYLSAVHPLPRFLSAERNMIYESAKADVDINITLTEIQSPPLIQEKLPWKMIRIDIKNLKIKVDHHFDFMLDGHKRKYYQHVSSFNNSHYDVHLVREIDGFKIPFGNVNAISLIALLRMGLTNKQKNRFYGEFLQLPLYEDMAPWNIVFSHGKLQYIDFDTKDVTYDKLIPAAYRILMVLTNYERTVQDFGKCGNMAETEYGFTSVAKCVGSMFTGPCKDPRYPVPCGDNTCRSTFIECLQAFHNPRSDEKEQLDTDMRINENDKNRDDRFWSFNKFGPVDKKL